MDQVRNHTHSTKLNGQGCESQLSKPRVSSPGDEAAPVRRRSAEIRCTLERSGEAGRGGATSDARLAMALIDEHKFTRDCIATCLQVLCTHITVTRFPTATECMAAQQRTFDLVVYHAHGHWNKGESSGNVLATLNQALDPTPVMVISDVDNLELLVEALNAGARGYIPTIGTSLEVAIEVIRLVRAGGVFAPVSAALIQRASNGSDAAAVGADRFTRRQSAVLGHLQEGDANKVIAHKLEMSEATVKVHIRNIMRKMQATNRTQAAFRAYKLEAGGIPPVPLERRRHTGS